MINKHKSNSRNKYIHTYGVHTHRNIYTYTHTCAHTHTPLEFTHRDIYTTYICTQTRNIDQTFMDNKSYIFMCIGKVAQWVRTVLATFS